MSQVTLPDLASEARLHALLRVADRKARTFEGDAAQLLIGILKGKYPPLTRDEIDEELRRGSGDADIREADQFHC